MRIQFIKPNNNVYRSFTLGKKISKLAPVGLMYLASYLEKDGHTVSIMDADAKGLSDDEILDRIKEFKPDLIGSGSTTPEIKTVGMLHTKIKDRFPDIISILGGPHPSAIPHETLQDYPVIDYIVRNEGEVSLAQLIKALENNISVSDVEGISFRQGQEFISTPERTPIEDIDTLPFPARHLIDPEDYKLCLPGRGLSRSAVIQTIRGCPFKCVFCYRSKEFSKVRYRRPVKVVDEIEDFVNKYDIRTMFFCDDTFTLKQDHVIEICDEIIRRKIDISWYAMSRADRVTPELLDKMTAAGLKMVTMGVESGSQEQLKAIGKKVDLNSFKTAYNTLRKYGIETRGSFVIGLPNDTPKSIKQTINFSKTLSMCEAFFNISTPYPGTVLREKGLAGDGFRIVSNDWAEYRRWGNAVIELDGISREDLIQWQKRAMMEFYLRPRIIWHHLFQFLKHGHFVLDYQPKVFSFLLNKLLILLGISKSKSGRRSADPKTMKEAVADNVA